MDIPRYRIGNDLTVLWAICNNDGTPFDLSGKGVRLFVTNDRGMTEVVPTITTDKNGSITNVILWTFLGNNQKVLGKHTLTVEIVTADDKRVIKRDISDAFNLVARSEGEESGGEANAVDSGTIYLSTKLDVYRFGNARVEIGTNGNWYIDGYDTGRTALAGEPGIVHNIYTESDLGKEFDPDSKIDTFNAHAINAINNALKRMTLEQLQDLSLADLEEYDVLAYNGNAWLNVPFRDLLNIFKGPSESSSGIGDGFWYLNEQDGKIHTDIGIVVHGDAIVEGDTSSGGSGEDVVVGIQGVRVNGTTHYDEDGDGVVDLGTIESGGGGLTSVSWGDIQGTPPSVSTFDNDVPYVTDEELKPLGEEIELLSSMWHLDENGNLVTDKQVLIKNNLIIEGDTSSGGEGEDVVVGIQGVRVNGTTYYDDNGDGIVDLGTISGGGGTADLSNYYTKAESDNRYLASSLLGSNTLIHSGNIGSYNAGGIAICEKINTQEALDAFNDAQNLRFVGVGSILPSPIVASDGIVISIPWYNTTFGAQIAIDDQSNVMLLRTKNQNVWRPWSKIVSTADDGYIYGLGGMIDIQYTDEINRYGGNLYIQHRGTVAGEGTGGNYTGHIIMCANGGNVGIGVYDPQYKLDVNGKVRIKNGSERNPLTIDTTGTGSYINFATNGTIGLAVGYNTSSDIAFIEWTSTGNGIYVKSNGNVGIGTSRPTYKLDVAGNIRINPTDTSDVSLLFVTGTETDGYYDYKIGKFTDKNGVGGFGMAIGNISAQWTKFLSLSTDGNYNVTSVNILTNLVVSGDTSSGSDIRFKDVIKNKTLKIEHIAKAPLFTFKWNDREDDSVHLGSSAQYWENIAPWLVKGEDFKTLDYSTLGVAMGISLAKKAVNHEERIKVLEKEIKRLKEEMIYG